ncbi:hypothetical protein [Metallibacterium sp.]|uniref:hypothetical protein n=1 Tax=Metallibacterium sp. TaxID=2940281 RepID=UPI002615DB24|nr:hypothetical protein [Metallibacterium sp.]
MRQAQHHGSRRQLHASVRACRGLERRLDRFHGVGPITVNRFLRERPSWWAKSDPEPLPRVKTAARQLAIPLARYRRKNLTSVRLEAGPIRHRRELTPTRH